MHRFRTYFGPEPGCIFRLCNVASYTQGGVVGEAQRRASRRIDGAFRFAANRPSEPSRFKWKLVVATELVFFFRRTNLWRQRLSNKRRDVVVVRVAAAYAREADDGLLVLSRVDIV